MNTERILHIADLIEKLEPQQFDMSDYVTENECGAVACIAGWTYLTYGPGEYSAEVHLSAAEHLGLNRNQADELFIPDYSNLFDSLTDWDSITPAHAAQTLRKLAETGEVDWSHVV